MRYDPTALVCGAARLSLDTPSDCAGAAQIATAAHENSCVRGAGVVVDTIANTIWRMTHDAAPSLPYATLPNNSPTCRGTRHHMS